MDIYEALGLPEAARIDRVVAKKMFYDNGDLSTADKKSFENVEKIYWRYALKTENSFIQPYKDEEKEYPEIEVLEVQLRQDRQLRRLAEIIMGNIPYPMLLLFSLEEKLQLYMGRLRPNQANKERMSIAEMEYTGWLAEDDGFWQELHLSKMPTGNFCNLYEAWFDAISRSHLAAMAVDVTNISGDEARERLQQIQSLEQEISKLRRQMQQESQFNRKLALNTKLQKLKKEKARLME